MVKIIFSEHVLFEIERRKLDRKIIEHIIQFPDQEIPAKKDRVVIQGIFRIKNVVFDLFQTKIFFQK